MCLEKKDFAAVKFHWLPSESDNLFHDAEKCFTIHRTEVQWD